MTAPTQALDIPQRGDIQKTITLWDLVLDPQTGEELSRSRRDLTGKTLTLQVKDEFGVSQFIKSSAIPSQILIAADQSSGQPTLTDERGQAAIFFVGADTELLDPEDSYFYDILQSDADGNKPAIGQSLFNVLDGVQEPSTNPPPATPGLPASQSDQERTFFHTWSATGLTDTVTIPGNGMVDASYVITYGIEGPAVSAIINFPTASRASGTFLANSDVSIDINTIIGFHLRDA